MKLCISQATTMSAAWADDVSAHAGVGWAGVEVWLTKLERHLETASEADARGAFVDAGVAPAAASFQGGLLQSQGDRRREQFEMFRRRLDLCQRFGVPTLVVMGDFAARPDEQAVGRAVASLKQAAQWAAGFGVRLALEFRGSDAFCSCLDTAVTLVEHAGEPNVGVCLDVFHYYRGPSKPEDLDRLTAANLFHVQASDVAGVPREMMSDTDRVMPGDGDFRFGPIFERLKAVGYEGWVSLEVLNPVVWEMKLTQVSELGLMALRRVAAI